MPSWLWRRALPATGCGGRLDEGAVGWESCFGSVSALFPCTHWCWNCTRVAGIAAYRSQDSSRCSGSGSEAGQAGAT
ncbi:hypothetical protein [Streptomyces sp. CB02923]|uniref:hypothetical protein n=1 Tax=Streptomyces sp. CB02923 TaxID=1718985 RepID=UPI001901B669|nr:hypothetical protein [Streptomyces sp. CB02923]